MSSRIVTSAIVIIFGLFNFSALGAGKDTLDPMDILRACNASASVCVAACKRKDNFSGQLSESLCVDDCMATNAKCIAPISENKNRKRGTTGIPETGKGTLAK